MKNMLMKPAKKPTVKKKVVKKKVKKAVKTPKGDGKMPAFMGGM